MRQLNRLGSLLVIVILLTSPALAQGDVILRVDRVDAESFPTVYVDVTVRNEYGTPVRGLTAADFAVSEDYDGQRQPVTAVESIVNDELPIAVVIVLDVSGSMQGQALADAKVAALRFLERMGAGDRVALIAFADTVDLDGVDPDREHPFTGDIATLQAPVRALQAGGQTPLYDVAYKAVRWAAAEPVGNRAVLLLSDGKEDPGPDGDKGSETANDDSAIREAGEVGVPVYTIGLGKDIDEPYLRRLAHETDGTYQRAPNSAELVDLFQNVANLLKEQVRITYKSGVAGDGLEHTVEVEVRAQEREASGKATFLAPSLVSEPLPIEPTTVTPTATATVTTTPTATSTTTGTATPTPTPTPANQSGTVLPRWLPPWLAGLGGVGLLLALGLGAAGLRQRRKAGAVPAHRCLQCGHDLESPDAPCPECGSQGSFQAPEG